MDALVIIGIVLIFLGIIGSILPMLPGPILSFSAIILLFISKGESTVSLFALVLFGITVALLIVMDYVAPILGAKFLGASKNGIWGAVIGSFVGLFLLPPLGIFVGAFLGAVLGEFLGGKRGWKSIEAGVGALFGSFSVIILQTIFAITAATYFMIKAF